MRRVLAISCLLAAVGSPAAAHAAPAVQCQDYTGVAVGGYSISISLACTVTGLTGGVVSAEVVGAPPRGKLLQGPTYSSWTYTPDLSATGPEDIALSIKVAGVQLAAPHIRLGVGANTAPACPASASFRAAPGQAQRYSLGGCTDVEPALSRTFPCCSYEIARAPLFGTATLAGGVVTYTASLSDQPLDAFLVKAIDLGGAVTQYWVNVNIDLPFSGAPSERDTFLLSKSLTGGFPDGPSRNAAISHDQRIATLMAYESDGTDIVPGDSNGATDVFVIRRAKPYGTDGTPWHPGPTELASKGMSGAPANGRSFGPAVDGDAHHSPHCVAFVSQASNLVPGDTNGVADAFVKELASGRVARVSVGAGGRQANGATASVTIDGRCGRLAFVSSATNLGGRTRRAVPRAYVRDMQAGLTTLVSASERGRAANGRVLSAEISRNGRWVAFDSEATNLVGADRDGRADVYRAAVDPRRIDLVSRDSAGRPGNASSTNPSITDVGTYVAYETRASNLAPGDDNARSDIVRTRVGAGVIHRWVSRNGNGASADPTISGAGEFVLFDSDSDNFKQSERSKDTNKARDVFLWNQPTGNVSRESRTPDNGPVFGPSSHPQTSSRGNYVSFESPSLLVDTPLLDRLNPGWSTDFQKRTALVDQGKTGDSTQVYLRYLGPK